ncbi:MAG: S8 family serine peptidase [Verrucomicrobiota bacterium]
MSRKKDWLEPEEARHAIQHGDGEGIRVAVLDSGIDFSHPKFAEMKIGDCVSVVEENGRVRTIDDDESGDVYGHGTAVAGIIHEVAPKAEIGSFRVLDARNLSRSAIIARGVRLALNRGYDVLNCSFGCKGSVRFIMAHKQWVDAAWLAGVHVVSACSNFDVFEPEWPAHFPTVLAVDMARTDSGYFFFRDDAMVNFAARGEDIAVAWTGGGMKMDTGSSFAAPRVTGYLARLLSAAPDLSPALAIDLLQRSAEQWQCNMECM